MKNTFNIHRFSLLIKRQWLEFGKIYLIALLVAFGVMVATYGISLWPILTELRTTFSPRVLNFREPLFLIFGLIFITIIGSSYFAHLGQKPKAIIDLLIPASTFEKFLTGIFFTSILAVLSFVLLFYLADLAFIIKLRSLYDVTGKEITFTDYDGKVTKAIDHLQFFFVKNNPSLFKPLYAAPFFAISVFLLGSIYFNKFHYIKTAISVMIFSGIWTYIIIKMGETLFDGRMPIQNRQMNNSKDMAEFWGLILLVGLTLIFWSLTYIRLKEKEV